MRLRVEQDILQEQRKLIADELRTTNQRVNLFEKVKIPEARENIRVIKIFLGDEQTAGVVRAKIAKSRTWELESDGVRHAPAMAGVEEAGETEADQGAR
jgi:V/A-type H+-transporting ATPase subunit D